jgi:hypothetical protein
MSSTTLREVLEAVPSLGAEIASFNELIPGVPTTKKNLTTLFDALKQKEYISFRVAPNIRACYRLTNHDDDEEYDEIEGPRIAVVINVLESPLWIPVGEETFFKFDADGFYKAILWVKEAVQCVIHDRLCKCDGSAPRAPKRRKLTDMDLCIECLLRAAAQ